MTRALAAVFLSLAMTVGIASAAHAQTPTAQTTAAPPLTISLIRAVRLSDTSITLSFRTNAASFGEVAYTEIDGSKLQLTDSAPETDHLFTLNRLDPTHGYSFALSASVGKAASDTYTVLLEPASIGNPGLSVMPGYQETTVSGDVATTTLTAASTVAPPSAIAPWWVFVLALIFVIALWIGYGRYRRVSSPPAPPQF